MAADVDLERLARTAIGLSGADLANLCNEAALGAARHDRTEVTMEDLEQAWDKIVLGVTEQRPTEERYNYSRTDLLARIDVMFGGRESEARA